MIWRDRIVTADSVIMPEKVRVISFMPTLWIETASGMCFGSPAVRIDRATDMQDRAKTPVFENDRLTHPEWGEGVVSWYKGAFWCSWTDGGYGPLETALRNGALVTGMVAFGEEEEKDD